MIGQPNPIAFTIFGLDVRWYGVLIALAMIIAVLISCKRASRVGINSEDIFDMVLFSIPLGIVGARLYYVIFTASNYTSLIDVVNIRNGGLAIHGGLILGIATAIFIAKRKKISNLDLLDLVIPSIALAQAIGRWGNYFNGEAHGGETDLPWGIIIDGVKVHPTFLYESLWCLGLFVVLSLVFKKRKFKGEVFSLYLMIYSVERFLVEGLRTDSLMLGFLKQAQIISIVLFICGISLYLYTKRKYKIAIDAKPH